MESIKELYKIGNGPSSSHTMGPEKAAKEFLKVSGDAISYRVELYGSLAATGKGHLTDWIIIETLKPKKTEVLFLEDIVHDYHTNGMKLMALDGDGNVIKEDLVFSVGGGSIKRLGDKKGEVLETYSLNTMEEISKWCKEHNKELWEYVQESERGDFLDYLKDIWDTMTASVEKGINSSGFLPGTLKYPRKAQSFYRKSRRDSTRNGFIGRIFAYTLSVSEENASGGRVVTAPTCGASGVIPGLLYALREEYTLSEREIFKALSVGGIIGNLIKKNATISGAEGGCQAEVGSACAMAAAMSAFLLGGSIDQIEYAAEMALEHHLGLTCDPVGGYVQIPCIERNAAAAVRALDAANYALYTDGSHVVTFDQVVETMKETGADLKCEYKETSKGGLAKYDFNKK